MTDEPINILQRIIHIRLVTTIQQFPEITMRTGNAINTAKHLLTLQDIIEGDETNE